GMSMCVLGMAAEFADAGIAFNALWPRTGIATAAIKLIAGDDGLRACRKPAIVADAAHIVLTQPARELSGHFRIHATLLHARRRPSYRADTAAARVQRRFLSRRHPAARPRRHRFRGLRGGSDTSAAARLFCPRQHAGTARRYDCTPVTMRTRDYITKPGWQQL